MAVTDPSLPVAIYLAGLPDTAWSDLDALASDVTARFRELSHPEIEKGIAISFEIARARIAEHRTPKQVRIAAALAEAGVTGAAELVSAEWAGHIAAIRPLGR